MFTRHYAHWPPGVPKTLSVPRTSIYFNLEVSARRYPEKAALHYSNWAKAHMAAFKYPRVVQFVEQLPKTATGKIFWRKLQEEENRKCAAG
jgi:acyl-coenzyme A synthetase/AMP-(fatty) acid ligase